MNVNGVGESRYAQYASFEEPEVTPESSPISALLLDGDIGAQIAALTIRSAQNQRELYGRIQVAEEAAIGREEAAHVAELHAKADHVRMAGYIEGGFTMAGGGCKMAGSFAAAGSARDRWNGAATISDGAGSFLASPSKGAQGDADARAAQHEFAAARHKRALESASDAYREGGDLLEKAIEFYKANQQSESDAASASARRA
jgi:hypothetical protein